MRFSVVGCTKMHLCGRVILSKGAKYNILIIIKLEGKLRKVR